MSLQKKLYAKHIALSTVAHRFFYYYIAFLFFLFKNKELTLGSQPKKRCIKGVIPPRNTHSAIQIEEHIDFFSFDRPIQHNFMK